MQITPTLYRIPKKVVISMTETEKKYDAIRRAYPETISKEQFYRIAHISKATALHLLQNGLSVDFGTYSNARKTNEEPLSMPGWVSAEALFL